jgi:hypothetical protein
VAPGDDWRNQETEALRFWAEVYTDGPFIHLRTENTSPALSDKPVDLARGPQLTTLPELLLAMKADDPGLPEWHNLPTFGGPDIESTAGIWSWDATHYIEGTCADDLELLPRDDTGG